MRVVLFFSLLLTYSSFIFFFFFFNDTPPPEISSLPLPAPLPFSPRRDDELAKVVLRPHQMRAVERALVRAADPKKRHGLVWHTQGSGKTYTMITLAKRLIEEPVFKNPTVLMLVDRTELEAQLFGNLS